MRKAVSRPDKNQKTSLEEVEKQRRERNNALSNEKKKKDSPREILRTT